MGVKDHLEDGTGHILSLGLDLDYLHVEGAERSAHLSTASIAGNVGVLQARVDGPSSSSNSTSIRSSRFCAQSTCSSRSSCSNLSEESAVSDSDDERLHNGCGAEPQIPPQASSLHLHGSSSISQAAGLDLGAGRSTGGSPQPETSPPAGPVTDYRTKVEFALKLGYSEELVLLVLKKLGPGALINDILGELVKLGTKTEVEQQGASSVSQFGSSLSSSLAGSSSLSSSASSLDSCQLHRPSQLLEDKENLRPVVVDGSNVAMSHGNKEVFSCQGIQLAVDWFLERGHQDITVFVPAWRKEQSRPDALITDQEILRQLEKEKILVFTPSRRVQGRRVVCYDDRFIVKLAYESDGIIVSNDNYRDLANEKPEWKKFIDERLLMYSFVNDKFMPPDDPLGRHGPSLENFLRKRPVIPEHRKQPCPYGKKCTYGHKCKFYHPERGSQPQRSVADELRASAKLSSVATRGLLEDALMAKSQSCGHLEGMAEAEQSQGTPKKQPNPSPRASLSDLLEDRLRAQSKVEGRRGSNSSSGSSCSSSFLGHQAAAASTSSGSLDRWEHHSGGLEGSRVAGAGPNLAEAYHRCESPDLGYSSLVKAYSSLSLVVPQSPECFYPADLRAGSLPSDCSSEGSVSSDSFSPDPLLDDGPKCYHPHHHPHHHHHCPGQCTYPPSRAPPGFSRHPPHGHTPQMLPRQHGFGFEESQPSVPSHPVTPRPLKSSAYIPSHPQHSLLSSFPGEFQTCPPHPHPPQSSPVHGRSQSSLLGHSAMGSLWQEGGLQEPQIYKGSPLHSGRSHFELSQQQIHWDPRYQSSPKPHYDQFAFQSPPEVHDKGWYSPWGRKDHSSPHGLAASSLPPLPQLPLPPIASPRSHLTSMPQHQEAPALARYQELKERVFVNLCRIFPSDLVRMVMARKPHVVDAQELAAAILMEKSQHRS